MYDDGFHNMENMDISPVVIDQMKERNTNREGMTWEVMDVRDLKYAPNTFDLAIDKSIHSHYSPGTIDALLCGEDAFVNVAKMTKVPVEIKGRKSRGC